MQDTIQDSKQENDSSYSSDVDHEKQIDTSAAINKTEAEN